MELQRGFLMEKKKKILGICKSCGIQGTPGPHQQAMWQGVIQHRGWKQGRGKGESGKDKSWLRKSSTLLQGAAFPQSCAR